MGLALLPHLDAVKVASVVVMAAGMREIVGSGLIAS